MIMRNRALALVLASACFGSPAIAKPTIVEFDAPGAGTGSGQGTIAQDIDDKGDVAGTYFDSSNQPQGFVRRPDGSFVLYDHLGISPSAINARRRTTGTGVIGETVEGFVAAPDGTVTFFQVPDAPYTSGSDIDIAGDVTGFFLDANNAFHGFLRTKRGKFKTFDAPGAGTSANRGTTPSGISRDGFICGYYTTDANVRHGFVRDSGGTLTTVDPAGSTRTFLHSLNDDDTAVGNYHDANAVLRGLVRTVDGAITTVDLPGAGTAAGQGTAIVAINNRNFTAGAVIDSASVPHSFIRTPAGKATVFDPPDAVLSAGLGSSASAINKKNEIVGGYVDANGVNHSYIRLP